MCQHSHLLLLLFMLLNELVLLVDEANGLCLLEQLLALINLILFLFYKLVEVEHHHELLLEAVQELEHRLAIVKCTRVDSHALQTRIHLNLEQFVDTKLALEAI